MRPVGKVEKVLLTHRPVEEKDLPVICGFPQSAEELFYLFPRATFPLLPAQLRQAIGQRSDPTVVERAGAVVAFANFYRWETGGSCTIGNVIVSPTARGCGVGRSLIEQMVALAAAKHRASEVRVSCFNSNIGGLLLYEKLGFQPYALEERPGRQGERVALIHLRRRRDLS